jgi:hypothetical protein
MQGEFLMPLSTRSPLVPVVVARVSLGVTADAVIWKIESGEFLWVWEIGVHGESDRMSNYRIWVREFFGTPKEQTVDEVIPKLIGHSRAYVGRVELSHILCVSRVTVKYLVDAGELQPHGIDPAGKVTRSSVEAFFQRRWVGNVKRGENRMAVNA